MNFWEVFEAAATRFADRTAVELQRRDSVDRHSYRELHDLARAHAAGLAAHGVGPGDRCAILADNDGWWCGAYLGALRLGAVAVPLDTNDSAAQIATIVRDSGARALLAGARLMPIAREALAGLDHVALLDLHERAHAPAPDARPPALTPCPARASDPAVILYTSGTTADPKGVVLTHGNLMAERAATFQACPVSEHDSVLGVLPLFHSLAQLANLLLPFAVGARVVFLETLDSTELMRALAEREITIFACVPQFFYLIHQRLMQQVQRSGMLRRTAFRQMLRAAFSVRRAGINIGPVMFGRIHRLLGSRMRLFITGGSKFDPAIGRDFYALGFTILQAYGLTETSGAATLTAPDDAQVDTVGKALPGQEIKVLLSETADLDGEIAVRGPVVMLGYFNRPEATAAVMRDGWLLTGDLGRLDERGRLTITGRKKDVIVLSSGKNIYPEEIEAQYRQSAFVREICVLGLTREDAPSAERLYAVVVPDSDLLRARRIVNAGDLLRFEMEGQAVHLPPHKRVLGYELWFEPLPRTTTGKVKRHEIARLLAAKQGERSDAERVTTEADRAWLDDPHVGDALGVIRGRGRSVPGPEANLELDLGLDSMERVELLTELEQRFAVRVPAERAPEIFTVRQLVEAVRPGAGRESLRDAEESWAVLLRDLPPVTDPVLGSLLKRRPMAEPLFFLASRAIRGLIARVEVRGLANLPATGPYIISPNHQSYLDPLLVCGVLPYQVLRDLFFVGATEYFETPFMRWLARQCNLVPVDPDANLVPAMKAGAFGLAHGKILMLFPEGERSIDGTVKRFKKGAPILSQHLGVPVVPVALSGAYEIWPRNRSIDWSVVWPWSRHRVRIAFGPPLQVDESTSAGDAAEQLRAAVRSMWDELSVGRS